MPQEESQAADYSSLFTGVNDSLTAKHGSSCRLPGPPTVFEQVLENPGSLRPQ